ncbi:MAG: hypothetical protein BWX70_00427 [Verrucomicrobia bacterium ADurb.Bin070]|nr:MAG: hypothetical protein BWX70_00427 [Verrucomicrobia bacterium ADurb.Bin070]
MPTARPPCARPCSSATSWNARTRSRRSRTSCRPRPLRSGRKRSLLHPSSRFSTRSRSTSSARTSLRTASASTAAARIRSANFTRRSASCPGRTARRFSSAARPRPWDPSRSAPRRTRRISTPSPAATPASPSCCTTTSRPTASARSAASAAPAAARSGTAPWPSVRSRGSCRRIIRTASGWSRTSWGRTAPPPWPPSASARWQ